MGKSVSVIFPIKFDGVNQVDLFEIAVNRPLSNPKTLHESARRRILSLGNHGVNFEEPYNLF